MGTFTSVATVSYRYYDKRNRSVAEQNIQSMARSLELPSPTTEGLRAMSKPDLIKLAMWYHNQMPED